ncbi:MAG TPA: hypothetical protein VMU50_04190 [Polyangia bacterium]|nr:hypothetical protein [Polyangia bacterium]
MRLAAGILCALSLCLGSCARSESTPAPDGTGGRDGATAVTPGSGGAAGAMPAPDDAGAGGDASPAPGGSGGSSGSGGSGGSGGSDASAPLPPVDGGPAADAGPAPSAGVHIVFPPPGAASSQTIVVRGTATFASAIGAVRVNGTTATTSDAFATFRAVVPLALGDNVIAVSAEDETGGALGAAQVTVRRFADDGSIQRGGGDPFSLFSLSGFFVDDEQRDAIICDTIFDGLVRIDLATGDRSLASASESSAKGMVGSGYNDIGDPRDVALDRPGHALLVDGGNIVGVDLATGDRTLLSGPTVGTGPMAVRYFGVGVDSAGHRTIALDFQGNALFAVDAATGNRSVLSSATLGNGRAFNGYETMELDLDHHRALTTQAYANPIIAIDLVTGDRSVLSGDMAGSGPALGEPTALAIAPAAGLVFAWDQMTKRLVAVELATGNRRVLADATTGMGAALPATIEHLAFGHDLLYARANGVMLAVDPLEGHRVVVSR